MKNVQLTEKVPSKGLVVFDMHTFPRGSVMSMQYSKGNGSVYLITRWISDVECEAIDLATMEEVRFCKDSTPTYVKLTIEEITYSREI